VSSPSDPTAAELAAFNLTHHIAPVVPKFMVITGVVIGCGWFVSLAVNNPNLGYLAVLHALAASVMIALGLLCQRVALAGKIAWTTVISIAFVFCVASTLCLTAANNNTGLLQSLPYCMVLSAVSGFFWPNRWGLVLGSVAVMIPPVVLVATGHSTLAVTSRFLGIYAQLWLCALAVSFALYILMNRVRLGYLIALHDLREQSRRDMLTGLFNRRYFYDQLGAGPEGADARIARGAGLLVYLDIDHFKSVNDRFGHAEGDQALQLAANALRAASIDGDILARFGGEEFIIFSPTRDTRLHFDAFARALQESLRAERLSGSEESITMSAGGTLVLPGEAIDIALQRADDALMRAKLAGRNRMVFAPSPPAPIPARERTAPASFGPAVAGSIAPATMTRIGQQR
jgi:diguanylate cyclase (GGDEF)-like protein